MAPFFVTHLSWECLGISQEELECYAWERDVWNGPAKPAATLTRPRIKWMDGWDHQSYYSS